MADISTIRSDISNCYLGYLWSCSQAALKKAMRPLEDSVATLLNRIAKFPQDNRELQFIQSIFAQVCGTESIQAMSLPYSLLGPQHQCTSPEPLSQPGSAYRWACSQWIRVYITCESLEKPKPAHGPTDQGGNAAEPYVVSNDSIVSPYSQFISIVLPSQHARTQI